MIPAAFEYRRASSVTEALGWLASDPESTKLLAGGHSLLPLMKLRLARPEVVVDVSRIPGLSYVRDEGDHVSIGALTRHRDLEVSPVLQEKVPLLSRVAGQVGDPQVRHRGTIGGSLAHGDPASDLPAAVLALGATLVVHGARGERTVEVDDFFRGFLETAIGPDEMLTELRVPTQVGGWGFEKFNRRAQDWAIVGVALVTGGAEALPARTPAHAPEGPTAGPPTGPPTGQTTGPSARIALVNMASTTVRALAAERSLAAGAPVSEAAEHAADGLEPPSDIHGSAEYRRHLATVLVRRALEHALGSHG